MLSIALVGRPNVGKSTLFNRLAGKKLAIVDDTPGVTRDWRDADGYIFDQPIRIIDTAGLEESFDDSIPARMRRQTEAALEHAEVVVFIVDGRAGITPMDEHFAGWLRKQGKPVILAVNKCENDKVVQSSLAESFGLGLGDPITISAEHGIGIEDLYNALTPYFPEDDDEIRNEGFDGDEFANIDTIEGEESYEFEQDEDDPEKPIKIAIVGRPNVGKSTLLNAIVNDQRVMTGPEAGITRDAITVDWEYEGRKFKLVDTAGMRRKSKVVNTIEKMSVEDSMRAIRLAQVVVLVLDANDAMEKQDLQIADHVIEEGRALIIAINKWDTIEGVENGKETILDFEWKLKNSLAQIGDVPFITLSALKGKNVHRVLNGVQDVYEIWNKRIKTAGLNKWLQRMESQNPAPLVSGRQNRLKYIAQIKTRPPTFAMWVSRPEKLPPSYRRFIINGLRRDHDLPGIPVRLLVRRSKNPYSDSHNKKRKIN